jgi:hypothetical protein
MHGLTSSLKTRVTYPDGGRLVPCVFALPFPLLLVGRLSWSIITSYLLISN